MGTVASLNKMLGRKSGNEDTANENKTAIKTGIRMSGTRVQTLQETDLKPTDGEIDGANPQGRQGNDWLYPDFPRGMFVINQDPGDRLQDFANTHLGEGPNPGRIPRPWNFRTNGKIGSGITGNPDGEIGFQLTLTGNAAGGTADAKYIQHIQIPRGSMMARTYSRTIDDAASIPAIYVADGTRR
jgi:hypothetical protein